jgi:hypothetical protein
MPIYVYNCQSQNAIGNATFSVATANLGGGNYYMYVGQGENICVGAPGYATACGNTDSYGSMWASLCPAPPPAPSGCDPWS